MTNQARYDDDGQRTTDCCGSYSTYCGDVRGADVLCCKNCYEVVPVGQGDGNEFKPGVSADEYFKAAFAQNVVV